MNFDLNDNKTKLIQIRCRKSEFDHLVKTAKRQKKTKSKLLRQAIRRMK